MEFYLVTTKCGHVGKGHYVPITFPIKAENGKEAAKIARMLPRVKHHHWDAIQKALLVAGQLHRARPIARFYVQHAGTGQERRVRGRRDKPIDALSAQSQGCN